MEKLGINPLQFLAQAVNFLIVLFVLKKFLYKPVLTLLEKRQKAILKSSEAQADIEKRLGELTEKEKQIINAAKAKADEIIKQAQSRAKEEAKNIAGWAKEEAKKLREKLVADAEAEIFRLQETGQQKLVKEASQLAKKAIAELLSKSDQQKFTEVQISKLLKAKK